MNSTHSCAPMKLTSLLPLHQVEAVENHMPEIVIVDEIGTEAEALACRTIAERGVQLIATAHGQLLENLLKNPTLSDLVGGIQSVTLGDPLDLLNKFCCFLSLPKCSIEPFVHALCR